MESFIIHDGVKQVLGVVLEEQSSEMVFQALLYECVLTVSVLECTKPLVAAGLQRVSGFLQSKHNNVKYMGLAVLEIVFKNNPPRLSSQQESCVLSCLDHPDLSMQRKTLSLLVVLANKKNVKSVVDTIIGYIKKEGRSHSELIDQVVELVTMFQDSLDWYTSSLLRLIQVSRGKQSETSIEKLKFLLVDPLTSEVDSDPATVLERNRVRLKLSSILAGLVEKGTIGGSAPPTVVALWVWCEGRFCGLEAGLFSFILSY